MERKLLAQRVTTPKKHAACAAAASALRRKVETELGAARLVAAALARLSTSLLARGEQLAIAFLGDSDGKV